MIFYWGCNLPCYGLVFIIFRGWVSSILWVFGKGLRFLLFLLINSSREMISLPRNCSRGDAMIYSDSRMLHEPILTQVNF